MIEQLREQGVNEALLKQVEEFIKDHPLSEEEAERLSEPSFIYYGKTVWEKAISAILAGQNLLLYGPKATGKNVLADNLAWLFKRPSWNISFHVNTDSNSLIGADTFKNGEVQFRQGPIAACAEQGGFGILDEINMARNDAIAVLHAVLDYRRIIDLPGYHRIHLRPETRFVATMNYGYVGTRELNEALTSRFLVIQVPTIGIQELKKLISTQFPTLKKDYVEQFALLFNDLQMKSDHAEISTKGVDLRGLLAAIGLMQKGLSPLQAMEMGIIYKTFDRFEQDIVRDVVLLRIPDIKDSSELFETEAS